jgi:hypothetical protein
MKRFALMVPLALGFSMPVAQANEAEFLQSLAGSWSGSGIARRTAEGGPININCESTSSAEGTSFQIDSTCRALAVVRQSVSATLTNTGGTEYQGTYTGPEGGQSALAGSRSGETIELNVTWAREVNGDNQARMQLQRTGENGMVIRTIDTNAAGEEVVMSEVNLTRN